jgi:hypothetical protein
LGPVLVGGAIVPNPHPRQVTCRSVATEEKSHVSGIVGPIDPVYHNPCATGGLWLPAPCRRSRKIGS